LEEQNRDKELAPLIHPFQEEEENKADSLASLDSLGKYRKSHN